MIKYSPLLEEALHRRKRPVWVSWRMDETYIKVKGQWCYLYRAVEMHGATIDFLLTEHRDKEAALQFLKKAIRRNELPETITIDGSDAHEAAIKRYSQEHSTAIVIRQVKYGTPRHDGSTSSPCPARQKSAWVMVPSTAWDRAT